MRFIFTLFILAFSSTQLLAQSPQRISYQAVVRNSSNGLVSSTQVGMRISILQGSSSGSSIYAERHTPTTNENGLLTIEIGGGTVESGTFSSIPWANGPFFIKAETDPTGGSTYTITGTTQLLSVPYSLYANTAGNGLPPGTQAGQMLYWDGTKWTMLPKGTNGQYLKWCNDTLTWGPCLPVLKTKEVKDVNDHPQAIVDVAVLSDGGSYILEFGICVSKNPNPTYPNDQVGSTYPNTQLGITQFGFDTESNTQYYVRAFAVSDVGVAYSNEINFTSKTFNKPVVLLDSISSITTSSAILWGKVSNGGGATVNQRGFVWDTIANVSTSNNSIFVSNNDSSTFSRGITNLKPNKKYFVRAFAANNYGLSYSAEQSFQTDTIAVSPPPPPAPTSLTDIDGNVYPVVKIANKHWISKNLDVTHYKNGDTIPQVQDPAVWASLTTGAWCYYENQTANGTTYGKLYNWYALTDSRGLAPEGWRVPEFHEWRDLADSLGGFVQAGGKLKATTLWDSPNTGATNTTGFSGLPGGYRLPMGNFSSKGLLGFWWTPYLVPGYSPPVTTSFLLTNESGEFMPSEAERNHGYSIRLIWNY